MCVLAMLSPVVCAQKTKKKAAAAKSSAAKSHNATGKKLPAKGRPASGKHGKRVDRVAATAESRRLTSAFTASAQLRPMAQQLVSTRTPAAYNGVSAYAASHSGEASAAAQLALGHAYSLDRRYPEAQAAFRQAGTRGTALADYADYLGAQAALQAGRGGDAYALLDHFADRHPGSIFVSGAPVLLANAYLQQNNAQGALAVLTPLNGSPAASKVDFRLALAKAYQAGGNATQAADLYRGLYLNNPSSSEAAQAKAQLQAMNIPLSAADRKRHADAMFNAKHYSEARRSTASYRKMRAR